jgi:hypothetical protein
MSEINIYNKAKYYELDENSNKNIISNLKTIKFKEHQKTAINAMIEYEEDNYVNIKCESYIKGYEIKYNSNNFNHSVYLYQHNIPQQVVIKYNYKYKYGILADKVGSGKTFIIMGLIMNKLIPKHKELIKEDDNIIIDDNLETVNTLINLKEIKTNLIIVPHNIIHQWNNVFKFSKLKTYVISRRKQIDTIKSLIMEHILIKVIEYMKTIKNDFQDSDTIYDSEYRKFFSAKSDEINKYIDDLLNDTVTNKNDLYIENYDVIIISNTMLQTFYNKFKYIKWSRLIIDEIMSIKLPYLYIYNKFSWYLTATPRKSIPCQMIANNLNAITDYLFNHTIVKNNDVYVDSSIILPDINRLIINCLTPQEIELIRDYIDDITINMLHGGDLQGAINRINCNIETSDNILDVITHKLKIDIDNENNKLEYHQKITPLNKKSNDEIIKNTQEKISSLQAKFTGLVDRIKKFKEDACPVCLSEFDNNSMVTNCCNNLFCINCLSMCQKCPLCRQNFDMKKCILISDTIKKTKNDKNEKSNTLCYKVDNLIEILNKKPNGKFLIFSNYDQTFENLNEKLILNNIKFSRLIGTNDMIKRIIDKFSNNQIKVLMLNAKNYGSGINLQMATDIIIYHQLDLDLETQVIGRAQRFGRTDPLNIYYLFNKLENQPHLKDVKKINIYTDDKSEFDKYINDIKKINENAKIYNNIDIDIDTDTNTKVLDLEINENIIVTDNIKKLKKSRITRKKNKNDDDTNNI